MSRRLSRRDRRRIKAMLILGADPGTGELSVEVTRRVVAEEACDAAVRLMMHLQNQNLQMLRYLAAHGVTPTVSREELEEVRALSMTLIAANGTSVDLSGFSTLYDEDSQCAPGCECEDGR